MHDTFFRWTTIVADAWQNIALVTLIGTVGALRRRVRALEGAKAIPDPDAPPLPNPGVRNTRSYRAWRP